MKLIINEMIEAAQKGQLKKVQKLFEQGFDINYQNNKGWTPLIASAARGHYEILAFLLKNGADPNKPNHKGTTPIMYAKTSSFGSGDLRALELLIQFGADIKALDIKGYSVLDYIEIRSNLLLNFFKKAIDPS